MGSFFKKKGEGVNFAHMKRTRNNFIYIYIFFFFLLSCNSRPVKITVAHVTRDDGAHLGVFEMSHCQDAFMNPISPRSPDLLAAAPSAIIYNPFTSTECVPCRA